MQSVWQELSKEIATRVGEVGKSIVAVDGRAGHTSSGIVWRSDAVLTAAHALRQTRDIGIILGSGEVVRANLAGRSTGTDIALLKLEKGIDAPPAQFAVGDSLA